MDKFKLGKHVLRLFTDKLDLNAIEKKKLRLWMEELYIELQRLQLTKPGSSRISSLSQIIKNLGELHNWILSSSTFYFTQDVLNVYDPTAVAVSHGWYYPTGYSKAVSGEYVSNVVSDGTNVYIGIFSVSAGNRVLKYVLATETLSTIATDADMSYINTLYWDETNSLLYACAGDGLFSWDGSSWTELTNSLDSNNPFANTTIVRLSGSDLYICANNYSASGMSLYKYTSGTTIQLGSTGSGGIITALAVNGSDVYIGGSFGAIEADSTFDDIGWWNGSSWSSMNGGTQLEGIQDPIVTRLYFADGWLYAAGDFLHMGGVSTPRFSRWDGNNWYPLDTDDLYTTDSSASQPLALRHIEGSIYIGWGAKVYKWVDGAWTQFKTFDEDSLGLTVRNLYYDGTNIMAGGWLVPRLLHPMATTALLGFEAENTDLKRDDSTMLANSADYYPTQAAVKGYAPRKITGQTTAPTTDDDATAGYSVGDIWIDETNDRSYKLLDSTATAAVWEDNGPWNGDVTDIDIDGAGDIGAAIDDADEGIIYDSSAGANKKFAWSRVLTYVQALTDTLYSALGHTHVEADITDLDHTDADAIHDNVSAEINALTEKATLVDADEAIIEDSAVSYGKKKTLMSDVWTYIQAKIAAITDLSTYGFFLDEDTMTSNDATKVASQQSIKAYVDAQAAWDGDMNDFDWSSISSGGMSTSEKLVKQNSVSGDTEYITINNLIAFLYNYFMLTDGWVDTTDTWTRASATTFTVSGDVTSDPEYQPGTKIKVTDSGGVVYGVIESASYSSPNTTVTLIQNDDYSLAAGSLSNNYISHIETPDGWPHWFNYTPTTTAGGSMTVSNDSYTFAKWSVQDRTMRIQFDFTFDLGGTADATVLISYPGGIAPIDANAPAVAGSRDASSGSMPTGAGGFGANNCFVRKYDISNWTLSTSRRIVFDGCFEF